MLAKACYHLGNRHVPLQIMPGELRYHHDHVLDDMLRQFGLEVTFAICRLNRKPALRQRKPRPQPRSCHDHGHDHHHHEHSH
jgi:urease accessory protein